MPSVFLKERYYVIENIDSDEKVLNIPALVKVQTGANLNPKLPVILRLTGKTTKLEKIISGGAKIYLKSKGDFTLHPDLKVDGQERLYLVGSKKGDKLTGSNNGESILGIEGNDRLDGGDGDDWLVGGDGDDSLVGGKGNDLLQGGSGNNTYDFHTLFDSKVGKNVVDLDDSEGEDRIWLDNGRKYLAVYIPEQEKIEVFLMDLDVPLYDGTSHITVNGWSPNQDRKLVIQNREIISNEHATTIKDNDNDAVWKRKAVAPPSEIYRVVYTRRGHGEGSFQTVLPEGTKEIYLPKDFKLISLHGPKGKIEGASQKLEEIVDTTGKINKLLGIH